MPRRKTPPPPLEWEHGKVVSLDNGSWWIGLYYRDTMNGPWKPCWRSIVNHARFEPFHDFVKQEGSIQGYAHLELPDSMFTGEEV